MEQKIVTIYDIPSSVEESDITDALTRKRTVIFHDYLALLLDGSTPFSKMPSYLSPQRFLTVIGREPTYESDYWVYFEGLGMSILASLRLLFFKFKRSECYRYCTIITRSDEEYRRLYNAARSAGAKVEITNDMFQRCHICPHPHCGRSFATEEDLNSHMDSYSHTNSIHVNVFPGKGLDFGATVKAFLPYNPIKFSQEDDHISVYFNSYEESNIAIERMNNKKVGNTTVSVMAPLTEFTVYISGFPDGTTAEDIESAIDCDSTNYILFRGQKHMCFVSLTDEDEYDELLGTQIRVRGKILTVREKIDGPLRLTLYDLPFSATEEHIKLFYRDMEIDRIEFGGKASDKSFWYVTFRKESDFNRALKMYDYFGTKIRVEKVGKLQDGKKAKKGGQQQPSTPTPTPAPNKDFSIIVKCPRGITESDIKTRYKPYGIKELKTFQYPDWVEYHITFTKRNGYARSFEIKTVNGRPVEATPKNVSLSSQSQTQSTKSQPQQQKPQTQQKSQPQQKTQPQQKSQPQPSQQTKKGSTKKVLQSSDGGNNGEDENFVAFVKGYNLGATEADLRKLFSRSAIDRIEFNESKAGHYCYIYFKDKASFDAALAFNGVNSLMVEKKRGDKKKKKRDAKSQADSQQQPDFLKIPPLSTSPKQSSQPPQQNPFAPPANSQQQSLTSSNSNPFAPTAMSPNLTATSQQFSASNTPTHVASAQCSSPGPTNTPPKFTANPKPGPIKIKQGRKFRRMRMVIKEEASELIDDAFNFDDTSFEMSLEEAVKQAKFHDIDEMMDACNEKVRKIGKMWSGVLTEDDLRAILIYTYESDDDDVASPYKIVNSSLGSRKVSAIRKVRGYVLYLLRALRKLPKFSNRNVLYRGINGEKVAGDKYQQGNEVIWSGFSSATIDEDIAKDFTVESESPMLFIIHGEYIGYNIEKVSFRETEKGKAQKSLFLSLINVFSSSFLNNNRDHTGTENKAQGRKCRGRRPA